MFMPSVLEIIALVLGFQPFECQSRLQDYHESHSSVYEQTVYDYFTPSLTKRASADSPNGPFRPDSPLDSNTTMGSLPTEGSHFKKIQNFKADYALAEFTQYESQRTGLRVVVVDRKGPKVTSNQCHLTTMGCLTLCRFTGTLL